jgi:hypothetical protein
MRVIGHQTDAMFNRYDITDNKDKLAALEAVRRFVAQQRDEKPFGSNDRPVGGGSVSIESSS